MLTRSVMAYGTAVQFREHTNW